MHLDKAENYTNSSVWEDTRMHHQAINLQISKKSQDDLGGKNHARLPYYLCPYIRLLNQEKTFDVIYLD